MPLWAGAPAQPQGIDLVRARAQPIQGCLAAPDVAVTMAGRGLYPRRSSEANRDPGIDRMEPCIRAKLPLIRQPYIGLTVQLHLRPHFSECNV